MSKESNIREILLRNFGIICFGNSSAIEYNNLLVLTLVALPQSFYAFDAIRSFWVIIARPFIIQERPILAIVFPLPFIPRYVFRVYNMFSLTFHMINSRHAGRNSKRSLSFDFSIIYSISLLKPVTLLE